MLRSAVEIQMSPGERTVGIKKQKKKKQGGWRKGESLGGRDGINLAKMGRCLVGKPIWYETIQLSV